MLNVNLETLQKDLEEAQSNLEREKTKVSSINETLTNQSETNIEKISTLEKYLSERDDIILEHEHKIETLQRSDFKNTTFIEEKVEEIKAKATECQDLKSSITKLESELKTSSEQVGSLQAQFDTSLKESQDLENQLKAAKNQVNQHEKEIQAKNKEVEELKLQSERYLNSKYQRLPQHERVYHRLDLKSAKIEISKLCLQLLRVGTLSCLVSKISV